MKQFEVLDISGDVGLRVFGNNLEELFTNASIGFYSLITDLDGIKESQTIAIKATGESLESLLVAWLNELVYYFDAEGFIGKVIKINNLDEDYIKAEVTGEEFDLDRHERGLLIKAATYHNLKIEKKDGMWTSEVIFDI